MQNKKKLKRFLFLFFFLKKKGDDVFFFFFEMFLIMIFFYQVHPNEFSLITGSDICSLGIGPPPLKLVGGL